MRLLNDISRDTAVIKNDILHIKDKLNCLEAENNKQNEELERVREKVNNLNLEIVKISAIVGLVMIALGTIISSVVGEVIKFVGLGK